jgi:CRISPR-associated protein Csm5
MKTYKVKCEILSPVHIGCGHQIDPLDYVIEDGILYKISFEKLVLSMDDSKRQEFESVVEKGNLVNVRTYVSKNFNKEVDAVYRVIVSSQVDRLYKAKIGDIQNQLIINPFIRTQGETLPFFPGSSIKGAIRTAVVSEQAKQSNVPKPATMREEYEFEGKVLGYRDGKDDPFRAVKIRDTLLRSDELMVKEVKNVSRGRNGGLKANQIQMICEVSQSQITGQTIGFDTEIIVDDALISTRFLSTALGIEQIVESCRTFYRDKMEKEHNKFYRNSEVTTLSQQMLDAPLGRGTFLLRIGRFSGVESVTLDNYRNPRAPGGKGWGSSRNLAEGIYPMGWVKITVSQ